MTRKALRSLSLCLHSFARTFNGKHHVGAVNIAITKQFRQHVVRIGELKIELPHLVSEGPHTHRDSHTATHKHTHAPIDRHREEGCQQKMKKLRNKS